MHPTLTGRYHGVKGSELRLSLRYLPMDGNPELALLFARHEGPSHNYARDNMFPLNWTLSVEGFGKIAKGEVTMAPLVVLVGKNNTGKSYLSSLLWGALHAHKILLPATAPKSPSGKSV